MKILLSIFFFFWSATIVFSQKAYEIVVENERNLKNSEKKVLDRVLKEYNTVQMDALSMYWSIVKSKELTIKLPGDEPITLTINSILSPSYYVEKVTEVGVFRDTGDLDFFLLKWEEGQDFGRFFLNKDGLEGYIKREGATYYIRPITRFVGIEGVNKEDSLKMQFIFFTEEDWIEKPSFTCGWAGVEVQSDSMQNSILPMSSANNIPHEDDLPSSMTVTDEGYLLEIATEADYEFFQRFSSSTNYYILLHLNEVEGYYNSYFNISFLITYQHLWQIPDNWGSYYSADYYSGASVLHDFQSFWNVNMTHIDRDLTYLFTNKKIGDLAGMSNLAAICKNATKAYAFTRFYWSCAGCSGSIYTTVHEVGHAFNARHSDGDCTTTPQSVMCQGTASSIWFSNSSQNRINEHISNYEECIKCDKLIISNEVLDDYNVDDVDPHYYKYCQIELNDVVLKEYNNNSTIEFDYTEKFDIVGEFSMENEVILIVD